MKKLVGSNCSQIGRCYWDFYGCSLLKTVHSSFVWEQVEVSIVLHHAAAHALAEAAADLPEGKIYKQFLPMIREKGGRVYVMPDDQTMEALDTEVILKNHLKEPAIAELAAEAAMVIRF